MYAVNGVNGMNAVARENTPLRVHISPVGWENSRVVEPLVQLRADRVYLLTGAAEDVAAQYWKQVHDWIKKEHRHLEVIDMFSAPWSYPELLATYKTIIEKEIALQNQVFINVSTGTKIHATVGMLASMIWGAKPYYVQIPYHGSGSDQVTWQPISDIMWPPVYRIQKPDDEDLAVISCLEKQKRPCRKEIILKALREQQLFKPKPELRDTAAYNRLNRVLGRLGTAGFISVEIINGKQHVSLNSAGRDLKILFSGP